MDNFDFDGKAAIDFGCGTGSVSRMFTSENYLGIDCDKKGIYFLYLVIICNMKTKVSMPP